MTGRSARHGRYPYGYGCDGPVAALLRRAFELFRTLRRMTTRQAIQSKTASRAARLLAVLTLAAALITGCSSEGADTDCGLNACTVTFEVGADASASVLGIDAKLVGTNGDTATVEIAGEEISLTTGQAATEVAGLQVTLESVTDSQAVVRIARS